MTGSVAILAGLSIVVLSGCAVAWGGAYHVESESASQVIIRYDAVLISAVDVERHANESCGKYQRVAIPITQRMGVVLPGGSVNEISFTCSDAARVPTPPKAGPDSDREASGSGVVINGLGQILTNAHVIHACRKLEVGVTQRSLAVATVVAVDEENDLAVVEPSAPIGEPIAFKDGKGLRPGEDVVALGYPYSGLLASEANVARGSVTALAGLMDDSRFVQISAPIQPGNSGGPLLDMNGHLAGIDTSTLNAVTMVKATGSVPQNVNFAIKASVARDFLDAKSIAYSTKPAGHVLPPEDVSELGRKSTVLIVCNGGG